jgi:preprotein translocase subunit SecA
MLKLISKIFGSANDRELSKLRPHVDKINGMESGMEKLSDEQLQAKTGEFKRKLDNGAQLDDLLHEAFAVVREVGKRQLGMRHYDVQLIGGMVLHNGKIAEMKTGEGKTLVATLPMYLNALTGRGCHLITVNDYLASRDAEWMGRIYNFLGMDVGTITGDISDYDRARAYEADITYGTNNEFGFDYLRDNMKYDLASMVQRDLHYAIIDEVDSILIDEARTPLIISGKAEQSVDLYQEINQIIPFLKKDEDYIVNEEDRYVSLTDLGVEKVEKRMGLDNLYDPDNIEVIHHVTKALQAHTLYKKGEKYIVRRNPESGVDEVVIVDEFTGRSMPGRRWSDGLHQAIEAKEGVPIQDENETLATITFQNFFRMYDKLSGMTGTAVTEAEEFHEIYELDVVEIPTNKPVIRKDYDDLVYKSYREKFDAIVDQIAECNERDQPVLVGTTSVEKSEAISNVLSRRDIPHEVLNAKYHGREAQIVAQAGRKGSVTIATNMAGRGTDILLGGNPEAMAEDLVGEQELPEGASEFEKEKYYSDEYLEALEDFEEQCSAERQEVLDAGGLFIIGTERHESRRVDNQLRGRAGRQGDPGASRFFLSLEDDLLRLFGSDRIAKIMDALKMEEGVPIEHPMVSRSLENAQRKVEGRNFDIRKNLLEYDDVMDQQRKSVYGLRKSVLRGEDEQGRTLREMLLDLFEEVALAQIDTYAARELHPEDWDLESLEEAISQLFEVEISFGSSAGRAAIERSVWEAVSARFDELEEHLQDVADQINERDEHEEEDEDFLTSEDILEEQVRHHYLQAIDRFWRQHLQLMEQLRDGIGMRGYAQKDPKQEYKREGFNLFLDMMMNIKTNVVEFVSHMEVRPRQVVEQELELELPDEINFNRDGIGAPEPEPEPEIPSVGRNDPCPCGSGKKYKHCHGRRGRAAG